MFVSWNGSNGSASAGDFYDPTLPEEGTVFRILTEGASPLDTPRLTGPPDGTAFDRPPTLYWQQPEGATATIELSRTASFASTVPFVGRYQQRAAAHATIDQVEAGTYYWRAVIATALGDTVRSQARTFSVSGAIVSVEESEAPQT